MHKFIKGAKYKINKQKSFVFLDTSHNHKNTIYNSFKQYKIFSDKSDKIRARSIHSNYITRTVSGTQQVFENRQLLSTAFHTLLVCANNDQDNLIPIISIFIPRSPFLGAIEHLYLYRMHSQPREKKYKFHLTCRKTHNLFQYGMLRHPNLGHIPVQINRNSFLTLEVRLIRILSFWIKSKSSINLKNEKS